MFLDVRIELQAGQGVVIGGISLGMSRAGAGHRSRNNRAVSVYMACCDRLDIKRRYPIISLRPVSNIRNMMLTALNTARYTGVDGSLSFPRAPE